MPEPMPTAPILRQEFEDVNKETPAPDTPPVKRGRGRPKKDQSGQKSETPAKKGYIGGTGDKAQRDNPELVDAAKRIELANQIIVLVEQSGTIIAGDAAKMVDTEKLALTGNMDSYLKSKNVNDIPPGLMLTIGLGMYYGRVLKTEAADKITYGAKLAFWFKQRIQRVRGKNARSNSGTDGKRENDTGEKTGTNVQK